MRTDRDTDGGLKATTLNLGEGERRTLLARAAERTVTEGRPVSVSEVARELIRNAQREGQAAA